MPTPTPVTTPRPARSAASVAEMFLAGTGAQDVATDTAVVHAAAAIAVEMLTPLPQRLARTCAVAATVVDLAHLIADPEQRDAVLAAAWVHDIGYSPALAATGCHPIDGATYLRHRGIDEVVVSLVAHHSGARHEATQRGLDAVLALFEAPPQTLGDILTVADLSTTPAGDPTTCDKRIAEIVFRYPGTIVHAAITAAAPELRAADRRVRARLADAYHAAHTSLAARAIRDDRPRDRDRCRSGRRWLGAPRPRMLLARSV